MTPIGALGRFTAGQHAGWWVRVELRSGGYQVFKSPYPDFAGTTFDDWFEDPITLERFFAASDNAVDWDVHPPKMDYDLLAE